LLFEETCNALTVTRQKPHPGMKVVKVNHKGGELATNAYGHPLFLALLAT